MRRREKRKGGGGAGERRRGDNSPASAPSGLYVQMEMEAAQLTVPYIIITKWPPRFMAVVTLDVAQTQSRAGKEEVCCHLWFPLHPAWLW